MSFPSNPTEGDIIEVSKDTFFQWSAKQQSWIRLKGLNIKFDLATPLRDGLMDNEDLNKLYGLLLPPPNTTLTSNECTFTFDNGIFGFRSSKEHINIEHELTLIDKDESGFNIETKKVWKIHENTYGLNFTVNLEKLISEMESRGKLTYRKTIGEQGKEGEQGIDGIDRLLTGPKGETGNDGLNARFGGFISNEPNDFEIEQINRGIVDIRVQELNNEEYRLILTRANLGDPEFCPKYIKPTDHNSKWILVVDERPATKRILKQCETELCGVKQCGPDQKQPFVTQTFCATRLHYIDISGIEAVMRDRFNELLQELKETKEAVINSWLNTMMRVYNEQKIALCCALENCRSRREIQEHKFRIEDIRVHAARDGLGIKIDGTEDRQYVDTNPKPQFGEKSCPGAEEDTSATSTTGTGGSEILEFKLSLSCSQHAPTINEAVAIELPAGRYTAKILSCCCYTPQIIPGLEFPFNSVRIGETVWNDHKDDPTKFIPQLLPAVRANKPYNGDIILEVQGDNNSRRTIPFPRKGQFRDRTTASAAFSAETIIFEHQGGDVKAFWPVSSIIPTLSPNSPGLTTRTGHEGLIEVLFTQIASFEEEGEVGSAIEASRCIFFDESHTIDASNNTISFTPVIFKEGANQLPNPFAITGDLKPVIIDLPESGEYEVEITGCCIYDSNSIDNFGGGQLIITEDMFKAAKNGTFDEWINAWKNSPQEVGHIIAADPFVFDDNPASPTNGHAQGLLNDLEMIQEMAKQQQLQGFNLDTETMRALAANLQPYSSMVTLVYDGFESEDAEGAIKIVKRLSVKDDGRQPLVVDNDYVYNYVPEAGVPQDSERGGFPSPEEASDRYVGQKFQVLSSGGQLAIFFDDRDGFQRSIGNQSYPNPNKGAATINIKCITKNSQGCDKPQIELELPCSLSKLSKNTKVVNLEAGEYVAEVEDCCCGTDKFEGRFSLTYAGAKGPETLFSPDLGVFDVQEDAYNSYINNSVSFKHSGGDVKVVSLLSSRSSQGGSLKIGIRHRDCIVLDEEASDGTGTGDVTGVDPDLIDDFFCDLPAQRARSYQSAWNTSNCCGFLAEIGGTKWIVVKRSFGTDLTCGGGENIEAPCIREGLAENTHVAIAFPTVDGELFLGIPNTGFRRMFRDDHLEADLLGRLRSGDFIELRQTTPAGSGIRISGPITDSDTIDRIANDFSLEFGAIIFPLEV